MIKVKKILLIFTIILLSGCIVNTNDKEYDDETIKKAKEVTDSYIRNNFKNIETVELLDFCMKVQWEV